MNVNLEYLSVVEFTYCYTGCSVFCFIDADVVSRCSWFMSFSKMLIWCMKRSSIVHKVYEFLYDRWKTSLFIVVDELGWGVWLWWLWRFETPIGHEDWLMVLLHLNFVFCVVIKEDIGESWEFECWFFCLFFLTKDDNNVKKLHDFNICCKKEYIPKKILCCRAKRRVTVSRRLSPHKLASFMKLCYIVYMV